MTRAVAFANPGKWVEFDGERCTPFVTTRILSSHVHRYLATLDLARDARVLDIASGEGYGAAMLVRNGAAAVTGVDIDRASISRASEVYAHQGLEFIQADITRPLPFADASFDLVVSFENIEHIEEQEAFVGEVARVLTPDGTFVCSTPDSRHSDPDAPNPFHKRELTKEAFLELLSRGFSFVTHQFQGHHLGSVISGGAEQRHWQRTGFLEYKEDGGAAQRFYIIATASNAGERWLPDGLLHDGAIVSTLNKRIAELEAQVADLRKAGGSI